MRIATWNVNSIRARAGHVRAWLARRQPDLLLLQEIKCEAADFPDLTDTGYQVSLVGQRSYNGVAALWRGQAEVLLRSLPGLPDGDAQARYMEVRTGGIRVANLYLPNGGSGGEEGFAYKLRWMEALRDHARELVRSDEPCAFLGDYNVCPTPQDHAPGTLSPDDALTHPEVRARFRSLLWLGLTDAVRALAPTDRVWTYWDYQAGAWRRDAGLRIDHALLSPALAERLASAVPDRAERGEPQPSDHVPVLVELG